MKNWQAQFRDLRGKDLLLAVKQFVLLNPAKVNMENGIIANPDTYGMAEGVEPCGTAGCIAGWCCLLTNPEEFDKKTPVLNTEYPWRAVQNEAAKLLGFCTPVYDDHPTLGPLFFTTKWPLKFQECIAHTPGPGSPAYAQVVADRIDAFIAENYA